MIQCYYRLLLININDIGNVNYILHNTLVDDMGYVVLVHESWVQIHVTSFYFSFN